VQKKKIDVDTLGLAEKQQ